jgi:hypothetical protein
MNSLETSIESLTYCDTHGSCHECDRSNECSDDSENTGKWDKSNNFETISQTKSKSLPENQNNTNIIQLKRIQDEINALDDSSINFDQSTSNILSLNKNTILDNEKEMRDLENLVKNNNYMSLEDSLYQSK